MKCLCAEKGKESKNMLEIKQRELWVDNVKVIACILVVLGHFFQSMTKADLLPANDLYKWFNQTIYCFHVPLFFICSGYLYQKLNRVNDVHSWVQNICKKAVCLGVPYFTFSLATCILKSAFSSSTNSQIGGIFETLFLKPTPPYWYLYALFFIFLITPTFNSKVMSFVGLFLAGIFKALVIIGDMEQILVITYIFSNEIWFVIGMCINAWNIMGFLNRQKNIAISMCVIFVGTSMLVYKTHLYSKWIVFAMGLIACVSIIVLVMSTFSSEKQPMIFDFLAKYTMPIFLMHTLFAAPLRIVLLKLGVQNVVLHLTLGIAISFVGPIIATVVMEKSRWLEFFLYPGRFIKFGKNT